MTVSIAAVMRLVRNYFERECIEGSFAISGGVLEPMPDAPYIAISGSARHDGVFPASALSGELTGDELCGLIKHDIVPGKDETFDGKVWGLHPPDDFLALCEEISAYEDKNPIGAPQSESFGAYSYTRPSVGGTAGNGWEAAFSGRLLPYRRMFTEVSAISLSPSAG